ncbi:MAG: LysR family transcriptional regulator [Proteobacteria bacterium]|nr:MAG: LysR family transcriptional regulator [Pseudomonadota bacterium]
MAGRMSRGDQINWNQVYYFSQIAESGSLKVAAEKLGLSPSTLSEHLSQLEEDLGIKLFQRHHRKISLTAEGARLFQYSRQMFETGKRFIDIISPTALGCYPISIGLVAGSSYSFAHGIINQYIKRFGNISLNVLRFQHDLMESALLEAKLDFGFTDRRTDRKDIVQQLVVESELCFLVSNKVGEGTLKDYLQTFPLVICRGDRAGPSAVEDLMESIGLSSPNLIVAEYPSLVEFLCREGTAIAVLGRAHFRNDPNVRMLNLPPEFPALVERLYISWARDAEQSEAIVRLKEVLALAKA